MITAGVDVGSLWTKAVVVRDGDLCGAELAPTDENVEDTATALLGKALASAGLSPERLDAAVAIGAGKAEAGLAVCAQSELSCAARGARALCPDAAGVLDLGGESTRVLRLDSAGHVVDLAVNDKCAAGSGIFLDAVAKLMRLRLEDMGRLALESSADVTITSTCIVFAESEVVSLIHRQTPPKDILRALHRSIATRIFGLVGRVGLGAGTVAIGGLASNVAIRSCLEELMKTPIAVPARPQMVAALGAALLAADSGGPS